MLSDGDLEKIGNELDLDIVGVFSKNKLPEERQVGSYYVNMQNAEDGNGTHWTLAKIFPNETAIWFDSFGIGMPKEVEEFLKPFNPVPYNNRQIQDIDSSECGYFCLFCDYYLTHLRKKEDETDDYENFLAIWNKDTKKNTALLKK